MFEARGKWADWYLPPTDPDGFTTIDMSGLTRMLMGSFEKLRRIPQANWFALIGTIGKTTKTHFIIGTEKTYTAVENGELFCFANDVTFA